MAEEAVKEAPMQDEAPVQDQWVPEGEDVPVEDEVPVEESDSPEEDWRVQAIKSDPSVRARFDQALFGGGQEQAYEPAPDPVQVAKDKLAEVESSMPQLDEENMTAEQVTSFFNWQRDYARAQQEVHNVELQQTKAEVEAQKAKSQLDEYVEMTRSADPAFKDYEQEFRQYVRDNNIDPRLLGNRTIVDMIRKAIGYDHLSKRPKAKAPGAPPVDESYTSQGRAAKKQAAESQQLREPTELDQQLAAFYRMPVEDLIQKESEMGGDRERWAMKGAVQWSDDEKLRRAGIRR